MVSSGHKKLYREYSEVMYTRGKVRVTDRLNEA